MTIAQGDHPVFESLRRFITTVASFFMQYRRPPRRWARRAAAGARLATSLVVLGAMLVLPLTSHAAGGDPNWASEEFTDITGGTLTVDLDFTNQQGVHQTVNVEAIPKALTSLVPPDIQPLLGNPALTGPLSDYFNSQWSQVQDKNGQTQRDLACANIKNSIIQQVNKALNKGPYNINCNLASSGELAARVMPGTMTTQEPPGWHALQSFYLVPGGQYLMLSFWLPGNSVSFSVPVNAGPLNVFGDPQYT